MLFPLALKNESDDIHQIMKDRDSKAIHSGDGIVKSNDDASSDECTVQYEGPITRSKAKEVENTILLKPNILMSNHFYEN